MTSLTLGEARKRPNSVPALAPEVQEDGRQVRMLHHCAYWDGPLSGLCMLNGREHWFDCVSWEHRITDSEGVEWFSRLYVVVTMTDEQIAEEARRHALFVKHVGDHTDYTYAAERRTRPIGQLRNPNEHHLFYDVAKTWPKLDLDGGRVVGWWARLGWKVQPEEEYDEVSDDTAEAALAGPS